jgi:hypothetical protein
MNIKEKCERTKVNAFYHVANKSATNLCLILDWFSYNVHVNWWLYHMIWKFWHFFGYSPAYPWIHMGPPVLPWVGGHWLTCLHITYENIFWCKLCTWHVDFLEFVETKEVNFLNYLRNMTSWVQELQVISCNSFIYKQFCYSSVDSEIA